MTKFFILCILIFIQSFTAVSQNAPDRPNIIFIMTDDQSPIPINAASSHQSRPFGFNGDKHVYTPIIDNLAANGMIFKRAYVSSSICSPSRYAILTGRYAGRCKAPEFMELHPLGNMYRIDNNAELEEDLNNLPRLLQKAGYKTGFVGKSHVVDHALLNANKNGTNGFMAVAQNADPNIPAISAAMEYNHNLWVKRIKEFGFDYVDAVYAANLKELNNDSLNVHNVEYKNKAALAFIDESAEQPFFLYYSENIPHGPAPWNKKNGKYIRGLDANPKFTSKGYVDADYSYLPHRNEIIAEVNREGKEEKHAWLTWFDYAVGAVVDKLKEKGILENTLIIITSDHGNYNHGKATIYEGGIKVPLMMYWPRVIKPGSTFDELVQNIDYTPTFLDLAGVDLNKIENLDGVSLKNVLMGSTTPVHESLFFELGYARGVMTKDWKYITVRYDAETEEKIKNGVQFKGFNNEILSAPYYTRNGQLGYYAALNNPLYFERDQLFDMKNDSTETTNLFKSEPQQSLKLKKQLYKFLISFPERPYGEITGDISLSSASNKLNKLITAKIYPNPSPGKFEINLPENYKQGFYEVYNISGCLIKTGELTKNKSTLDMTNVEKGTYLVMVSGETIRLSQKIIIN